MKNAVAEIKFKKKIARIRRSVGDLDGKFLICPMW